MAHPPTSVSERLREQRLASAPSGAAAFRPGSTVLSADSHVVEPPTLWHDHIDPAFRDRAPTVVGEAVWRDGTTKQGAFWICEGLQPIPAAGFAVADVDDPEARSEANFRPLEELRSGGWDPAARLLDQDIDGVRGEVLYPSMAMSMFGVADPAFQAALFRAYNRWVADYCAHAPDRLFPIMLVSLDDVAAAVHEVERVRDAGGRGVMISHDPSPGPNYSDRVYDPFWAACAAAGLPVSLHILTGRAGMAMSRQPYLAAYIALPHPVQVSLVDMLATGVFARHPDLRVVSVENDVGWVPHFLHRLEFGWEEFRFMVGYDDPVPPHEHFRRRVRCTFQDDPIGVHLLDVIGSDVLMWASDYPHGDSTWPKSRETIERNFAGYAPDTVRRVVHDNVVDLYGLDVA